MATISIGYGVNDFANALLFVSIIIAYFGFIVWLAGTLDDIVCDGEIVLIAGVAFPILIGGYLVFR